MDWKDWETKYRITYSAASDESIDSMSQKIIAEFDRIYELLARLRKFDASTGTDVIDSVPYQLKVNTTTEEILIRNTANDSWYKIGKLADYFGITPKLIGAVKNKGNIENLQMGNEADKPLAENGIANDVYIACDTKKVFRHTGTAWELLLSLNFEELLGNTAVTTNDVVTLPTANKLLKMNSEGKLPTDITGSPQKIAGKPIDPTQLADGRTLVYRETSGNFEFEAKGSGAAGESEIDDTKTTTGSTYSSTKIETLLAGKEGKGDLATPYTIAYDSDGRVQTVICSGKTQTLTYDSFGRLGTITCNGSTIRAVYNSAGQYLGMEAV